jgi:hypothetical protein
MGNQVRAARVGNIPFSVRSFPKVKVPRLAPAVVANTRNRRGHDQWLTVGRTG